MAERCLGLLIAPLFTILPFNVGIFLLGVGIIALLIQIYLCKQEEKRDLKRKLKQKMDFKPPGPFQHISKADYTKASKRKMKVLFAIRK